MGAARSNIARVDDDREGPSDRATLRAIAEVRRARLCAVSLGQEPGAVLTHSLSDIQQRYSEMKMPGED